MEKLSQTIHYNWKLKDQLLSYCINARLNILPTNLKLYIGAESTSPHFATSKLKVWLMYSVDVKRNLDIFIANVIIIANYSYD